MRVRRLFLIVLMAAMAAAVTGCVARKLPDAGKVEIEIELTAAGGADVDLLLGGRPQARADLTRVGEAVAPLLFPGARLRSVEIVDDGGGPYPVLHAADVYRPGPDPLVEMDTKDALSLLATLGYHSAEVTINAPRVPASGSWQTTPTSTWDGLWVWKDLAPGDPAPAGSIRLDPQPWKGITEVGLVAASLVCVIIAALTLRRRWRRLAAVAAGVACAAAATEFFAFSYQTEHLAVTGQLAGGNLRAAALTPVVSMATGAAAFFLLVVALVGDRIKAPVYIFNPPPGWPVPPPGWKLPPGWRPDPRWPPAPPDWPFFVEQTSDP